MNLKEAIFQDFWLHFGGLIAIAIGMAGWYQTNRLTNDPSSIELMFMLGGFAVMGVKLVNGSAALLRSAVSVAKAQPAVIPVPTETPTAV